MGAVAKPAPASQSLTAYLVTASTSPTTVVSALTQCLRTAFEIPDSVVHQEAAADSPGGDADLSDPPTTNYYEDLLQFESKELVKFVQLLRVK